MNKNNKNKEILEVVKKTLKETVEKMCNQSPSFVEIQRTIRESFETIRESFQKNLKPFNNEFQTLPDHIKEDLIILGEHGWYMDLWMDIPSVGALASAFKNDDEHKADTILINYFENRISDIEESLVINFPNRSHLIQSAFNAHKKEEYNLSIPLLLSQTDGICKELINQYFFLKRNNKPRTALYVEQMVTDAIMVFFLSPLTQTLPISASEPERPEGFTALNRHTVLHGESLDYGTKTNSLKAISLINYIAQILKPDLI
ncbi:hypothetical protein JXI42_10475 [bacterium]|nr:hypothetical protein [bacterium]